MLTRERIAVTVLQLLDMLLVAFSFGLATLLLVHAQHDLSFRQFLSLRARISDVLICLLILSLYNVIFRAFGLYRSRRLSRRRDEVWDVLRSTSASLSCLIVIGSVFSIRMATIRFLLEFWIINTVVIVGSRLVLRLFLAEIRIRGRNLRHMLIFGTNDRAIAFARQLVLSPERGYRLVGFVDDEWPGTGAFNQSEFNVVCDFNGLVDFLRIHVVDEAVVYLPFGSLYQRWFTVATLCAEHGIIVRLNADTFGLQNARWLAEEFDGSHYIATQIWAADGWSFVAKRSLDIVISSLMLILLLPLFIAVSAAIKLTSEGPVFFSQERIGLNKRRFRIFKFRTMVLGAEKLMQTLERDNEATGPVFKMRNDPRITPIGKLLRRSSVDELPQLVNVLKGDMSLVGPRPLPVRDYEGFNQDWQRRRFSIRPGITCLWQVTGRSTISFDQWMRLDLRYIDEWSLWLDLKILAQTVPAVLKGTGAA
jgi:exopolysaccharide biosynthesis polyprenyl glycosylphosphotransferase